MKALLFNTALIAWLLFSQTAAAQSDEILGKWTNPDKDKIMEISKTGDEYIGTMIWMKDSSTHAETGDVVIDKLKYADGQWKGALHLNGRNATCTMALPAPGQLRIRGKMGIISRTKVWTRVED